MGLCLLEMFMDYVTSNSYLHMRLPTKTISLRTACLPLFPIFCTKFGFSLTGFDSVMSTSLQGSLQDPNNLSEFLFLFSFIPLFFFSLIPLRCFIVTFSPWGISNLSNEIFLMNWSDDRIIEFHFVSASYWCCDTIFLPRRIRSPEPFCLYTSLPVLHHCSMFSHGNFALHECSSVCRVEFKSLFITLPKFADNIGLSVSVIKQIENDQTCRIFYTWSVETSLFRKSDELWMTNQFNQNQEI